MGRYNNKILISSPSFKIGTNVKINYNNKILISSPSFKIGTNVKINLLSSENRRLNDDGEQAKLKDKPDVKPKVITKPNIKPNEKHKQDVKPNVKFDRESSQDVKEPDTIEPSLVELNNYEEEKVALILGTTAVFTVWWMFK